jgi:hypothetical protein
MTTKRQCPADVILLGQVASRTEFLVIACRACPWRGRLRTARLVREHGPEAPMPAVMRSIIGDCPRLHATDIYGRCDAHCPELPRLF